MKHFKFIVVFVLCSIIVISCDNSGNDLKNTQYAAAKAFVEMAYIAMDGCQGGYSINGTDYIQNGNVTEVNFHLGKTNGSLTMSGSGTLSTDGTIGLNLDSTSSFSGVRYTLAASCFVNGPIIEITELTLNDAPVDISEIDTPNYDGAFPSNAMSEIRRFMIETNTKQDASIFMNEADYKWKTNGTNSIIGTGESDYAHQTISVSCNLSASETANTMKEAEETMQAVIDTNNYNWYGHKYEDRIEWWITVNNIYSSWRTYDVSHDCNHIDVVLVETSWDK